LIETREVLSEPRRGGKRIAGAEKLNHKDLEDLKEQASSGDRSFAELSAAESRRYCFLRGSAKRCAHAEGPERRQSASSMAGNSFEVFGVFVVQFLAQR
jgi:hypothetical protein